MTTEEALDIAAGIENIGLMHASLQKRGLADSTTPGEITKVLFDKIADLTDTDLRLVIAALVTDFGAVRYLTGDDNQRAAFDDLADSLADITKVVK